MARKPPKPTYKIGAASQSDVPSGGVGDVTTGWVTLIAGLFICGFLYYINHSARRMGFHEYNLINTAFVLWVPLLLGMYGLRRSPESLGFGLGDLGKGTVAAFVCLTLFSPVIYYFAAYPDPQAYYLRWMSQSGAIIGIFRNGQGGFTGGTIDPMGLLFHQIVMGFYMFGWEFFFRGFLLTGLQKIMPLWAAIGLHALLFMALHIGKPLPETLSSFPGAILMAIIAVRFKSFLPCFLLHWLVSAGFDFAVLYHYFKP
ncbi:MAG: CPBP family intramembrane metalloprotease [Armatimonadetes bacterium]|nr:CPBP family intramembrane metalloprotease [Armatimonadota bacterium]